MSFSDVCNVVEYIYTGSLEISQVDLVHFLNVGKTLKLAGVENFKVDGMMEALLTQEGELDVPSTPRATKVPTPARSPEIPKPPMTRRTRRKSLLDTPVSRCKHCEYPMYNISTLKNHERFCIKNPSRSIPRCPFCQKEVKPGSMTHHKKKYHGYIPNSGFNASRISSPSTVSSIAESSSSSENVPTLG
jgi:hypothetical protein